MAGVPGLEFGGKERSIVSIFIARRVSATASTARSISADPTLPMQPTRKVSSSVSLPG